jgi:hypothetical protein
MAQTRLKCRGFAPLATLAILDFPSVLLEHLVYVVATPLFLKHILLVFTECGVDTRSNRSQIDTIQLEANVRHMYHIIYYFLILSIQSLFCLVLLIYIERAAGRRDYVAAEE